MRALAIAIAAAAVTLTAQAASAPDAATDPRFAAASTLFLEGRADEAIAAWGALRATSCSPDLEYNLGTVYLQRNDLGRAVFHLERATLLLSERDRDIEHNLGLARARVLGTGGDPGEVAVPGWDRVLRGIPLAHVMTPFLATWALLFILLILRQRAGGKRRRRLGILAAVTLLLVVLSGVPLIGAQHARHGVRRGVLLEDDTRALEAPDPHAAVTFTAPAGTEVRVFERENGFVRARLPNGIAAWVPEAMLGEL